MPRLVLAIIVMLAACTSATRPVIDIALRLQLAERGVVRKCVAVDFAGMPEGQSHAAVADDQAARGRRDAGRTPERLLAFVRPGHTPDAHPCDMAALPR